MQEKEVEMYRRFLEEMLFIYTPEHPQQALRRRIEAALEERWEDALLMNSCYLGEYNGSSAQADGERRTGKHLELLPEDSSSPSKRTSPWD